MLIHHGIILAITRTLETIKEQLNVHIAVEATLDAGYTRTPSSFNLWFAQTLALSVQEYHVPQGSSCGKSSSP